MRYHKTISTMDGYIHVAISNGVVSHVVRYDESMGDLVDPGSIYLARFRGILYPKFRISRRVIRNVASLIANRLFGEVVQLRYRDGDPLNLVSHNLIPIYPKRMEESIGDFQIIGRSGSKYKLRCAQCGYLRSSIASNAHKFSRCSRCARGRGRVLDPNLSLVGNEIICSRASHHRFTVINIGYFLRNTNRCVYCSGDRVHISDILAKIPGFELIESDYRNYKSDIRLRCPNGHEFVTNGNKIQRGIRCSACSPSLPLSKDDILSAITSSGYTFISGDIDTRRDGRDHVDIRCRNGHTKRITLNQVLYGKTKGCNACNAINYQSSIEKMVHRWLFEAGVDFETNDRSIISPLELDVYIPSKKIAIEVNGVYYHSTRFVGPHRHRHKYLICKEQGIILLTIFENDILTNRNEIRRIMLRYLSGGDIYERSDTIVVDCRYPLIDSGYTLTDAAAPRMFNYRGNQIYDCGSETYVIRST